jgi:hypothetical protein
MAGKPWSDEDLATVRAMAEDGKTDSQISRVIRGRSPEAVRMKRKTMGITAGLYADVTLTRVVSEEPERVVYGPEETDEEPFAELLERAKKATSRDLRKEKARRFARARIVTHGRPIALTFKSDQHLTMHGPVDVTRAFEDAEVVQQTPALYAILGGDGVDMHIKHRAAMVGKGSRPTDEWRLYDGYLKTLGNKILGVISGNHDSWTRDASGIDMVGILSARNRLHYAPDMMVMQVELVDTPDGEVTQTYHVKVRHQYRFNSSLNVGHVVKRMYDMDGDQFDVGVVCHNHEAHIESFERHGSTRWALRPGSYQYESSWSRMIGFPGAFPTCPGVVLWPDEHRIDAAHDLRELVERLTAARALAKAA